MEIDVAAEDEGVGEAVVGDLPLFGYGGLHGEVGVELYQSVEELLRGPNHRLILGKSGVERGYARRLVVTENLLVAVAVGSAAGNENGSRQKQ